MDTFDVGNVDAVMVVYTMSDDGHQIYQFYLSAHAAWWLSKSGYNLLHLPFPVQGRIVVPSL